MKGRRPAVLRPASLRRLVATVTATVAMVGLSVGSPETSPHTAAPPRTGVLSRYGPSTAAHTETDAGQSRATREKCATTRRIAPPSSTVPPLGVYTGPGGAPIAEALATQLGGRVRYALDFLPRTSWTGLIDPAWLAQRWRGTPFDLVIGVPMLPNAGATLAQGASGAYDPQFRLLAERLVADGLGTSILMLGYQPDDSGTPWYVGSAVAAGQYVRFWDAIASTMTNVPGANFVYEWDAGDAGTSPVSPAVMYPGNKAVGIVGTDAFDFVADDPSTAGHWSTVLHERFGPAWMASFAAAHHKPMAIAMWGEIPSSLGGAGDDARFVSQMLRWAVSEHLVMCMLWDYQALALTGGTFPRAAAVLRQDLLAGQKVLTPGGLVGQRVGGASWAPDGGGSIARWQRRGTRCKRH